jgi:hypothetical protein
MAGPAKVVEQYFDAWTSQDFDKARSFLHDDLSFRGPFETLDSADALMGSIQGLSQIVTGADRRGLFEQGDEAVVIYDLHTKPIPTAPVAA